MYMSVPLRESSALEYGDGYSYTGHHDPLLRYLDSDYFNTYADGIFSHTLPVPLFRALVSDRVPMSTIRTMLSKHSAKVRQLVRVLVASISL